MTRPVHQRTLNFPVSPTAAVFAIIAFFTIFRSIIASGLGIGVDEAYTISVAHDLNLSYFDHPPLQYWIVHFLMPLFGDGRAARLPFIALFAGSCWLLYRLTRLLFGAQAGVLAVLALNCSAVFSLADGGWVLPDGPLIFALLAAAFVLARYFFHASENAPSLWTTWLLAGFWIGLAGLSKYHVVLFVVGLLLYLVSMPTRRHILFHPAPWLGAVVALCVVAPVIVWNAQHDWVSVAFQFGRSYASIRPRFGNFFANVGGQIIWLLPWIFVPLVIAAWHALRNGRNNERTWFCFCLALPIVATFTVIPIWGARGLPHWQMPGWLMLFPVLGDYLSRVVHAKRVRRWGYTSAMLFVVLTSLLLGHTMTGYGRVLFPFAFAKGDPTLESFEWSQLRPELETRGLLRPENFIITNNWTFAAKIDLALKNAIQIVIFRGEHKQYDFRYDPKSVLGRDAIVIGRIDSISGIENGLRPYFASIEELPSFTIGRANMREIELRILVAHRLKTPLPPQFPQK